MACALGAVFSLAVAAVSSTAIGRHAARVYTANTIGAIVGSLAGGFVLLPGAGLQNTFRGAAATALVAGMTVAAIEARIASARASRFVLILIGGAAAMTGWLLVPAWDLNLLAGGAYKYAAHLTPGTFESEMRAWHLSFYEDGAAATVSVRE